jgi:predicted chitinase
MDKAGNILAALILCGLMGMLGQGVRAAVGLKSASRLPSPQADQNTEFSAAYFVLSLMIGFIAGVLAGIAIGILNTPNFEFNKQVLLGIAVSGYAGADFIENSLSIFIPPGSSTDSSSKALRSAAPSMADTAALSAHTVALTNATNAVQQLSAVSNRLSTAVAAPPVVTAAVPAFGAALHSVAPAIDRTKWEGALTDGFRKYLLTNNHRVAAAIGQFLVEAGDAFEEVIENMNYSAPRMMEVWPSTFRTQADALPYAHQPEKLGNFIYANRLGNGNEASGDGYRFRGRGLIQLTGRDEYNQFGAAIGMTAEQVSQYCETAEGAAVSGCWYLATRGCLPFADSWNLAEITRRVNGRKMQDHARRVRFSNAMLAELNSQGG